MRVYVVNGYDRYGGNMTAYHVGRMFSEAIGAEVWMTGAPFPENPQFDYPERFPVADTREALEGLSPEDIWIANPSLSENFFGLRAGCRTLCYVQDVSTFRFLDVFFDHYVSCSNFVSTFIDEYYQTKSTVIPPFIDYKKCFCGRPLAERSQTVAFMLRKNSGYLLDALKELLADSFPEVKAEFASYDGLRHKELLEAMGQHRVFLSLSPIEGFNMPMLEAMAAGCAVVGIDNGGCREYARDGFNCCLAPYGDLNKLASGLAQMLKDDDAARRIAKQAQLFADRFDLRFFEQRWRTFIRENFSST
jgi:hypothetical protein